jgi:lipopolysaccharide exporter
LIRCTRLVLTFVRRSWRALVGRASLSSELFASTLTFGVSTILRLASSLVVTRILTPSAYGVFGILFSILFIVELMSDVGTIGLLIRHPRGNDISFVHTLWTIRLLRSLLNFLLVLIGAPLIARIYHSPVLTPAFRLMSLWFLLTGAESMAFALAQRDRRARIWNYADMAANTIMTIAAILLSVHLRSYVALVYAALLQKALIVVASHFFYRSVGVGLAFDREAMAAQFGFARIVLPSSVITLLLSQYDRLVLLRLFDLSLIGVYGIASNIASPISGIIIHNARVVLYPRSADYFRGDPTTAGERFYRENRRLLYLSVFLPAMLAGCSQLLVATLYDVRYVQAGSILTILGLGAIVSAFHNPSENLLVAAGRTRAVLIGNIFRLAFIVPSTLIGYHYFGLMGFLYGGLLATIPPVAYFFVEQRRLKLLILREEFLRLCVGILIFVVSFSICATALKSIPPASLHFSLKNH